MTTYHIVAGPEMSPAKRAWSELARTAIFLLLFAGALRLANGHWIPPAVLAIMIPILFLGNLFTAFRWGRKQPGYDLVVDEDAIRMIWNRTVVRSVRKNNIRSIGEWGGGADRKLVISEHGPAFTRWLWGGIAVPASLPEYELIKAEVLGWSRKT